MCEFSVRFRLPEPSHEGCAFLITVDPEYYQREHQDLQYIPSSLPDVFRRILFEISPDLLFAAVADLENHIKVTIFKKKASEGLKLLERAVKICEETGGISKTFSLTSETFKYDVVTAEIAYDSFVRLYLESSGYKFMQMAGCWLVGPSFALSDLTIKTAWSGCASDIAGFISASSFKPRRDEGEFMLTFDGKFRFLRFKKLEECLEKSQKRMMDTVSKVRLDSEPCCVIPRGTIAYAVEYNKSVHPRLQNYWRYVHGIALTNIERTFRVTFTRGFEEQTLTYPSQCVTAPHIFTELSSRQFRNRLTEFNASLKDTLSTMIGILKTIE